jgi:hypothetical protein
MAATRHCRVVPRELVPVGTESTARSSAAWTKLLMNAPSGAIMALLVRSIDVLRDPGAAVPRLHQLERRSSTAKGCHRLCTNRRL